MRRKPGFKNFEGCRLTPLAWRRDLENRALSGATIRRKLAALSSLFEYLCEANAVASNPVKDVKRPKIEGQEGKTPAIGDHQARSLLNAPDATTLQGQRDRAILSTLLYHGLRRAELCAFTVGDVQQRRGVAHLRVHGKGSKLRYVPLHPGTAELIDTYLQAAGHADDAKGALFRPVKNNTHADDRASITADGVYKMLAGYAASLKIDATGFVPHALRATAATNALDHNADIAKVQEWLGHAGQNSIGANTPSLTAKPDRLPEDVRGQDRQRLAQEIYRLKAACRAL